MNQKHDSIIAREGYIFILVSAFFTISAGFTAPRWVALLFFLITAFIVWFFRNPERNTPTDEKLVVSPADGKVNRIPYAGRIETIRYYEGKFMTANLDKASSDNERNGLLIRLENGQVIGLIQIAGLVARRIVCWVNEGMMVNKGERFGLIRFGSRVDVLLPPDAIVLVKLGDKVRAGETPIGGLS